MAKDEDFNGAVIIIDGNTVLYEVRGRGLY